MARTRAGANDGPHHSPVGVAGAAALLLGCLLATAPLRAQEARQQGSPRTTAPADSACPYVRCALGIAPAWSGLDVVRGADGARVARLGFFWPRSLGAAFAGADSASHYAARAVRVRRVGAALTDAGALLLAYTAARAASEGRLRRGDAAIAAGGAGALAVSVPLQFRADGLLSRAVWWYNARFARFTP